MSIRSSRALRTLAAAAIAVALAAAAVVTQPDASDAAPLHRDARASVAVGSATATQARGVEKPKASVGRHVIWKSTKRVRIVGLRVGQVGSRRSIQTAVLQFNDGSSVKVKAGRKGLIVARFSPRVVSSATLFVTSARGGVRKAHVGRASVVMQPKRTAQRTDAAQVATPMPKPAPALVPAAEAGVSVASEPSAAASQALSENALVAPAPAAALQTVLGPETARVPSPPSVPSVPSIPPITAASASAGLSTDALTDARTNIPGSTGASWTAPAAGAQDVVLRWSAPVTVATLQLYGSPTASGAVSAARATFDDGSSVRLLPVPAGAGTPATIAFTPRTVTSVVVHLVPKTSAPIALREIAAFAPGQVAPTVGATAANRTAAAPAVTCSSATATATAAAGASLRLVCPLTGQALASDSVIAVSGPEAAVVTASAVLASGSTAVIGRGAVSQGIARIPVDATSLPSGPLSIRLTATGVAKPLTAQFIGTTATASTIGTSAQAQGRSLVFDDEFDSGLSISSTGTGTTYAATKPASWGGSEFGGAIFADPSRNPENISDLDGGYLRIRTTPLQTGETDPNGWGRTSRGGIVSSASVNGGFAAQHAYFETRMLAPAAPGTWPAFWMMSSGFLEDSSSAENSEVDAVELYGQDSGYSCHSWHDWLGVATQQAGKVNCVNALTDWSNTWHTYGVDISDTSTRYYIDGRLVSTAPAVKNAADPFYFMTNLSLGGGWPVDLSGINGVADLYVDYVRVYV